MKLSACARVLETSVAVAREKGICILTTALPMFTACGLLYLSGVKGMEG